MADFSEFAVPSADWMALEPTLSNPPDIPVLELKQMINKTREASAAQAMIDEGLNSKVEIQDYSITTRHGATLEARTYRPTDTSLLQSLPVYIHLHGGGFLFGTLSSEDATCSRIVVSQAEKGDPLIVFSINYRHTPEHCYPAAWDDVEDAFVWVHEHIDEIGGLSDQVVVGGVSAGAQLAASLVQAQLRGDNNSVATCPKIRSQVLMIPWLVQIDHYAPRQEMLRSPELSSLVQCAAAPILPISRIRMFMSLLGLDELGNASNDRRLNPGNGTAEEVMRLPPTSFGIAGNDPLRDEGLFYAKLLNENGVPTNVNVFRGVPHGFRQYGYKLSASKKYDEVITHAISWALNNPVAGPLNIKSD